MKIHGEARMNMARSNTCLDHDTLNQFLNQQLLGDEETQVMMHIEGCEDCRTTLTEMTGKACFASEIRDHLGNVEVQNVFGDATTPARPKQDALPSEDVIPSVADESQADLDQILSLLGPTDDPEMLGRIGPYEIGGVVGRGCTGVVFKAVDKRLNRLVAIKMLSPAFADHGTARCRFEREARSIAAVRDDQVISVFAVADHRGLPYIVMDYMPSGSLQQRIDRSGPLSTHEVTRIGMQIARALGAAHDQGIVHRDVKPANVLLENGMDRAIVTDFGLARVVDETSMTRTGAISGTPQFMSPEQARGELVDHRSDLFSLGSVLYTACTGHPPFRGETIYGVIKQVCETTPRPIRELNPDIQPWICDLINRLQCKDPAERFASAAEVADILEAELAYLQSPATVPKPSRAWRRPVPSSNASGTASIVKKSAVAVGAIAICVAALFGPSETFQFMPSPFAGKDSGEKQDAADSQAEAPMEDRKSSMVFTENPKPKQNVYDKGVQAMDVGELTEAVNFFKQAIEQDQCAAKAAYNIACCHALEKRVDESFGSLQQAIDLGYVDFRHFRDDDDLRNLRNDPRFKKILAELESIEKVNRRISRAIQLRWEKKYEEADKIFKSVLEGDPDNSKAILEYGFSLHLQGKLDEAIAWHRRAAKSRDWDHYGNYNIACYHSLKGEPDLAFVYFKKAIQAGLWDVKQFERDSDLDAIRDDERFEELIELAKSKRLESERRESDQSSF